MKDLIQYIITEIQTRIPELKTVRMFNNQYERSNNDDTESNIEAPFDYPALFVEITQEDIKPTSLGYVFRDIAIILHVGTEGYDYERIAHYELLDKVIGLAGLRGSSSDTVQFSSWIPGDIMQDIDYNNVKVTPVMFRFTYTDKTAYNRATSVEKAPPFVLGINKEIL